MAQHRAASRQPHEGDDRRRAASRTRSTSASSNGGVWKTTDAGRTWTPIFDDQPTGSIGALAVAPSDPQRHLRRQRRGAPASRSVDRRRHLQVHRRRQDLDASRAARHAADPRRSSSIRTIPNRLFVAALGHPYGPNAERGIFRSTDGGATFERVLYKDENTGGTDVVIDPANPNIVYAALWEARQGPWENGDFRGAGSGLFKSTDGGTTWRQLTDGPADVGAGRLGPHRHRRRAEPSVAAVCRRRGARGRGHLSLRRRRRDAGRASTAIRASWRGRPTPPTSSVHPDQSRHRLSCRRSWRGNRPTADARSPRSAARRAATTTSDAVDQPDESRRSSRCRRIRARSSRSTAARRGAPGTTSRPRRSTTSPPTTRSRTASAAASRKAARRASRAAATTARSRSASGTRSASRNTATSRPIRSTPTSSTAARCRATIAAPAGAARRAACRPAHRDYRVVRTMPVLFSPVNPRKLFFASNVLWQTLNGGRALGSDQPRPDARRPGRCRRTSASTRSLPGGASRRSAASSTRSRRRTSTNARIWAGTDDGLIHVTRDGGKTWNDVTPPALTPWAKVSIMDASHFDAQHRLRGVNTLRLDDLRPHIYRTQRRRQDLDADHHRHPRRRHHQRRARRSEAARAAVRRHRAGRLRVVRRRRSLAVAAINMPATSIRDLVIKDDDLVVGTHGRAFWILDDITPLRQIAAATLGRGRAPVHAAGGVALALEQEHRHAAAARRAGRAESRRRRDHQLLLEARRPRTVSTRDPRRAGSVSCAATRVDDAAEPPVEGRNTPDYWLRPQPLLAGAGLHRFVWDLHHAAPAGAGVRLSDRRDSRRHATRATRDRRRSGPLHGATHRGRRDAHGAADRADGSAGQDAGRRPAAAVHDRACHRRRAGAPGRCATRRPRREQRRRTGGGGGADAHPRPSCPVARARRRRRSPPTPQVLAAWKETAAAADAAIAASAAAGK